MDPIVLAVVAGLVLAALAAWAISRGRGKGGTAGGPGTADDAASRASRAAALGWTYDDMPEGDAVFSMKGEESGVKWKLSYRAGNAAEGDRPTLTWATRSVQGSATELRLIGKDRYDRGRANIEPIRERLSSLILSAREIADAQERTAFLERTQPAEVGSASFRESFTVVARNQRLARALFDHATEALVSDWPAHTVADPVTAVSAWLDWKGLRIDVEGAATSMATLEHLVRVGVALASRYRRHATTPGVTVFMTTQPGPSQG
jgi:hypothetical protein